MRLARLRDVVALAAFALACAQAQPSTNGGSGPTVPSTCAAGSIFVTTTNAALYICSAPDTWTAVTGGGGSSVPIGSILLIDSGSCPAGFSEVAALGGSRFPMGTLAANGDVGTTGGANTFTPAGTNSAPAFTGSSANTTAVSAGTPAGTNSAPTFTGSALATHAHELPWQIATTTTIRQIAVATFGTGTSRAATAVSAAGTANTTSAAVALSQAVSAGTPAGTVSAPTFTGSALGTHQHAVTATGTVAAPTFTGTQADQRPAWLKVIYCKKT